MRASKANMAIITLGTMAFDAIETPFGKSDTRLSEGSPAAYVALYGNHLT